MRPSKRISNRVFKRVPGGKLKVHIKSPRKGAASCSICGSGLKGASSSRSLRKTERRPERPFGGHLCGACTQKLFVYRTRVKNNDMKAVEVPIKFQKYL
ncbi:MAG: 50S ribosomal protein L34e [Candidatus Micrarchaeota archaeon]|nr:50S ribosomal protein L34e [Candidatus Micrarchaeota archaeon]